MNRWVKTVIGLICLFGISRAYILANPPYQGVGRGYSDVKQDYERYANMWQYGLTPYREHLFEYPPGAIPLTYLPLWFDLQGWGNYYQNYRIQIFLIEVVIFLALIWSVSHQSSWGSKTSALLFYILAGTIAKDYWYEGLDLVFASSLALAMIGNQRGKRTFMSKIEYWVGFFLSVAIKLLTAPLGLPLALINAKGKLNFKEIIAGFIGGAMVWIVPLLCFRSSLAVFLVVHQQRPLKYGSFGTFIIKAINDFTGTESLSQLPPHFPMVGPISTVVEQVTGIVFPVSVALFLIWSVWHISRYQKELSEIQVRMRMQIQITLIYFLTIFFTSKVFSSPFNIWYVPFLTILPLTNPKKQQWRLYIPALILLILDTTTWIRAGQIDLGPIPLIRLRDFSRYLMMGLMWFGVLKMPLLIRGEREKNHVQV